MPWCPKCKTEYRAGYNTCSDCGAELEDENPVIEGEPNYDKEAFLVGAADSLQADLFESLLRAYNIPVLKKYPCFNDYHPVLMGTTSLGIDLYVPSRLLQTAQDILQSQPEDPEYSEDDDRGEGSK